MANCPACACYTRDGAEHCSTCGAELVLRAEPGLKLRYRILALALLLAALHAYKRLVRATDGPASPVLASVLPGGQSECRGRCRKRCQRLWPGKCRDDGSLMVDCVRTCEKARSAAELDLD